METYEYPGYRCGPCPPGFEGNGTHCADINEVSLGGGVWWGDGSNSLRLKRGGGERVTPFPGSWPRPVAYSVPTPIPAFPVPNV